MASLYQRFTGKINTNRSFPMPPEASHLLGGQNAEEDNAGKTSRPPQETRPSYQYQPRHDCEEEDVRRLLLLFKTPFPFKVLCIFLPMICVSGTPSGPAPSLNAIDRVSK
ncbi:hypothetical protein GDO81_012378 [Engystomops pustulosus]|uniref:Uncharacterized protein n=1 Tax=Engystomops pustulosus TaxID=76066 RepID=A0AAV7BLI3_ENGPU|nr:hypothetical protein GDO81_012378 [Engystomops pustulosus]